MTEGFDTVTLIMPNGKKQSYQLPQAYNHCSEKQLLQLFKLQAMEFKDKNVQKFEAVRLLLGVKPKVFYNIYAEDLVRLKRMGKWVFENFGYTKNILQTFSIHNRKYQGPDDLLMNCTFIEFIHADDYASSFFESKDIEELDKMIATLWRPLKRRKELFSEDYDGDPRRKYNSALTERELKRISKLKLETKFACLGFIAGCKEFIVNRYDKVFQQGGTKSENVGWSYAQKSLAACGMIGNLEAVQKENLYNALEILQDINSKPPKAR